AGLPPGFNQLVAEFQISYEEASSAVSYPVLLLGISTFFWVPTASLCGKRPVLITSLVVFVLGCVWGHQATSFHSFLGSRILTSFGAGAVQAIGPALIGGMKAPRTIWTILTPNRNILRAQLLESHGSVAISVLSPQLFALPPFHFGPAAVGNWAATSVIGIVAGYLLSGLTDIFSQFISHSGEHRPEYRLVSLIIPFLVCSPGLILFGYTYEAQSFYGPAVGSAMQTCGLQLVPATVLSYAVDSYPYDASEVAALINAITHILPFALSLKVSSWLARVGVIRLFLDMAIIQWGVLAGLTLLLYFAGPLLRRRSAIAHSKYGIRKWLPV
ncbi:hypothetical protein N7474_001963, partial [Penicillium riverlandense]|uniref:uncharacterized protein n=1 Tax=Penicillium riverlandense TaxID=1903569 RepID=UPI002547B55C